jgi:hypothetical protein
MLIIFRPTVEITDASEYERGFPFCSGSHVGCNEREKKRRKNPKRASLMLAQAAAESEEELQQKFVFARWHDAESEKSASRQKRITHLED